MIWKDGELATRRGSSLPLKKPSNATSEVLKAKAVAKQNRFNSSLIKSDKALGYKLLYPDKSEVLREFTWQKDLEFTLEKYIEELGKPYSRISFYICSNVRMALIPQISLKVSQLKNLMIVLDKGLQKVPRL